MSIDEIVHVIAVWDRFVPAVRAVNVIRVVTAALVTRSATRWIGVTDFDGMFLDGTVVVHVVQMTIVQIVDVVAMLDSGVLAVRAVNVVMIGVGV